MKERVQSRVINQPLLRPIQTKGKVEILIERIVSEILNGHFKAGSQLPSERIIAQETGVSGWPD